jgi:hypothetical protein
VPTVTAGAPARPDEARSQRRVERRWIPVLALLGVIGIVTAGGHGVVDALAGPPEDTVAVGAGVQVHPAAGWVVERSERSGSSGILLLTRGTAVLRVSAAPGSSSGDPARVLDGYADRVLRPSFAELTFGERATAMVASAPAVQAGYVGRTVDGATVEGVLVSVASPPALVVFDAAAPAGDLAWVADDVRRMIEDAELA